MISLGAIMAAALAQAAAPAEEPALPSVSDLAAPFARLCLAPFPGKGAFEDTIVVDPAGFVHAEGPDAGGGQPGERWTNGEFTLLYVDRDALPPSIPAPQCRLVGTIASEEDHLAMVGLLETQLALENGKSSGRGGVNKTVWDITGLDGEPWRLFFDSRPTGADKRYQASLTIMQLPE